MAATIRINERNGAAPGTLTLGIVNMNIGNVDAPNLDMAVAANAIPAGENSFDKYNQLEVTAMGGSLQIHTIRVWRTGALGLFATDHTNLTTSAAEYGTGITYATPTKAPSTRTPRIMPETEPATANLGISGSLVGVLTAPGTSDLMARQIRTGAGAIAGATNTINFRYAEVA